MTITGPELKLADPTSGYIAVRVEMLQRLRQTAVDLFIQYDASSTPVLYYRDGCPLEAGQASRLLAGGIRQVYIRKDEFQRFAAHLMATIDSQTGRATVPPAERCAALQLAIGAEIDRVSRLVDCGPYVAVADRLGRELTSLLAGSYVLPMHLFSLAQHDFNTFTHVTNVASFAILLAEKLGLAEDTRLESVAKAAILHDIGKRNIPVSILAKPAKLDLQERAIIESHPQWGYEELYARGDMNHDELMVVYQHHERYDGKGYPVGYQREEIHPWARMLAVVDVFDALTGVRPYRRPATARDAMDYICRKAGTHFDPEMVACWNSMMTNS